MVGEDSSGEMALEVPRSWGAALSFLLFAAGLWPGEGLAMSQALLQQGPRLLSELCVASPGWNGERPSCPSTSNPLRRGEPDTQAL